MGCRDGGGWKTCLGVPASCQSRWEFLSGHPTPSIQGLPGLCCPRTGLAWVLHCFSNYGVTDGLCGGMFLGWVS